MTVIYFTDGAQVDDPVREESLKAMEAWLDGLPAGAVAADSLNPLVWKEPVFQAGLNVSGFWVSWSQVSASH